MILTIKLKTMIITINEVKKRKKRRNKINKKKKKTFSIETKDN